MVDIKVAGEGAAHLRDLVLVPLVLFLRVVGLRACFLLQVVEKVENNDSEGIVSRYSTHTHPHVHGGKALTCQCQYP